MVVFALAAVGVLGYFVGRGDRPVGMSVGAPVWASPTLAREENRPEAKQEIGVPLEQEPTNAPQTAAVQTAVPSGRAREDGPDRAREAAQVAAYFRAIDAIQAGNRDGNPQSIAEGLITAGLGGDGSGFEEIARTMAQSIRQLRALTPPSSCTEHHQRLLALLEQSQSMVRQIKRAIIDKDTEASARLASIAERMQSQVNAFEKEDRELRTRFNVR